MKNDRPTLSFKWEGQKGHLSADFAIPVPVRTHRNVKQGISLTVSVSEDDRESVGRFCAQYAHQVLGMWKCLTTSNLKDGIATSI